MMRLDMGTSSQGSKELSLEQARAQFPKMWVAMVVTRRDDNGQPLAGRVVAEDPDRYRLREKLIQLKAVCIFFAGESPFPLLL